MGRERKKRAADTIKSFRRKKSKAPFDSIRLVQNVPGMAALDMNSAEDQVVANTREVYPGMIITGMEVAEVDGAPRMGPTFGAMFISGQKAAYLALKALGKEGSALNTFTSLGAQEDVNKALGKRGLGNLFQNQ